MDEKVENALTFIKESINKYSNVATVCSFGKDSMVLLHLIRQVNSDLPVLWIKTPFLPKDTVTFAEEIKQLWNLKLYMLNSRIEQDVNFMVNVVVKPKLWKSNPELCCQLFKVVPAMNGVSDFKLDSWFSGMRKSESEKRGMYTQTWKQGNFTKLHPIIDFTEADVWRYIATQNIPVHPWYSLGYRSLGCEPCSFPNEWKSERSGRWKDTLLEGGDLKPITSLLCGIHCVPMK